MDDILNYLETSYISLKDYLIDKEIIIKDEEPFIDQLQKFLLKYKRLIGLILLIILILIPYICFDNENELSIQKGGALTNENAKEIVETEYSDKQKLGKAQQQFAKEQKRAELQAQIGPSYKAKKAEKLLEKDKGATLSKKEKKELKKDVSAEKYEKNKDVYKQKRDEAKQAYQDKKLEKKAALAQKKADKFGKLGEKVGKIQAKGIKGNIKSGLTSGAKGIYNVGAYAGEKAKDNAEWFYGLIYSIAITIAIFMLFGPAILFILIGIMCYFLLKDKIKYFKAL